MLKVRLVAVLEVVVVEQLHNTTGCVSSTRGLFSPSSISIFSLHHQGGRPNGISTVGFRQRFSEALVAETILPASL